MARKKQEPIESKDSTGLKYFDKLAPLLARLHEEGCGRDRAGNRVLHFDQYSMLILLYLFNPIVTSLRGIQQASALEKNEKDMHSVLGSRRRSSLVWGRKVAHKWREDGEKLAEVT